MDTDQARKLFERYRASVAYVEVASEGGDRRIGSAFHVGEGVFVTARHVIEGHEVLSVGTTEKVYIPLEGEEAEATRTFIHVDDHRVPVHIIEPSTLSIDRGPFFALDSAVDVAVFGVAGLDQRTPYFQLGSHLDDWIGESDFVLSQALVLGYPPIPLALRPTLVATRADVVSQIDRYDAPHVHFVLSLMPRGGFSGGVAFSEWGFVLGVLTQSLMADGRPEELGYFAVTSVEPIYACLADHQLLPDCQAEGWDEVWNSQRLDFAVPADVLGMKGFRVVAWVEFFDDGKRLRLDIRCDDADHFETTVSAAMALFPDGSRVEWGPGLIRIRVDEGYTAALQARAGGCHGGCRSATRCGVYQPLCRSAA